MEGTLVSDGSSEREGVMDGKKVIVGAAEPVGALERDGTMEGTLDKPAGLGVVGRGVIGVVGLLVQLRMPMPVPTKPIIE